ncbi:MAG: proline dehydrogenase family protein [Planctomycetota bacterium]
MALFSRRASKSKQVTRRASSRARAVVRGDEGHPVGLSQHSDARVYEIGHEFLEAANRHRAGVLSKQFWSDKLMDWSMKDHAFKVQLFRFVDTFPVLRHDADAVHDHLVDYLSQPDVNLPPGMAMAMRAGGLAKGTFTKTTSGQIESMAKQFIAGEDAKSALPGLKSLWDRGIAFSVDLLGEACVSDAEADMYVEKYMDLVTNLPDAVSAWKPNERLERDHLGPVPRTNVSIKISALSAKADPIDTDGAISDLMSRIVPILERAKERGVFINFDMEQAELKDLTLELFMRCCEAVEFEAGLAMQAYLKSGDEDARRIVEWSKKTGRDVTVRLVKGAYWDYETIHAEQMHWPCKVWNTKQETDACFERMSETFLDSTPRSKGEGGVRLALGSHNARSIAAAVEGLERRELPVEAIEFQMLHGMADQLKGAAGELGWRVREYVPVGEMIPGMAYLVRRLLENTSNESWLRAGFLDGASEERLLASPHVSDGHAKQDLYLVAPERHALSPAVEGVGDGRPFATEPMRDFSKKPVRETFAEAIARSVVPSVANDGTVEHADAALAAAHAYFPTWRDADPRERASMMIRAADAMRARRDELSGVIIKVSGKPWREADADVTEAIDFLDYYARHAVGLFEPRRLGKYIGELDEQWHQPRGVAVVISPWNFPLAICCGMTAAALVTGNTTVLKPAEQTPGIASILAQILWDAGVPREALHFIAAPGETVGAHLVRDPRVSLIAFTGSKAVGLDILQAAGVTPSEQLHVKKVVCEMGGKNAVIIDVSADFDEAVLGVRYSAFGFQGQKCSACSRVIVVDPDGPNGQHISGFVERLVESTKSLVVGDPMNPGTDVATVIDDEARDKIMGFIERAKRQGLTCAVGADAWRLPDDSPTLAKNVVPPHIFTGVTREHEIAREEIFGPVLAVMHAHSFDEALEIANDSPYKLTGGVFSRKPAHLEKARREFRVGNLYLNRGNTGALVGRQPFGGFGMSGVGSKAGGDAYLHQFVEPRACCENTMRRGFAPEL